jgi:DNA polymerase I
MVIYKAYLLDIDYTVKANQTYIRLLLKGKKGRFRRYFRMDPYFYAQIPQERSEELLNMTIYSKDGSAISPKDVREVELYSGIEKKKLSKIICSQPSDVPQLKAAIPFPCYEFSIPFARRFIYDHNLYPQGLIKYERKGSLITKIISSETGNPKLKTLAFDIETYNPAGVPREKQDPVIMISYAGKREGVITNKKNKQEFVQSVDSEKEMIDEFSRIVAIEDPDVILGYNSSSFDLPYLVERAKASKATFAPGSYKSTLVKKQRGMSTSFKIAGRIHADLYPMVRFFGIIGMIKTNDYTLRSVAQAVTKEQKRDIDKDDIWKLWDSDNIDELAEYSLYDARVAKELGERYLPIEEELSSLARLPLFDTTLATSGQLVENLLMFNAAQKGMLTPPKPGGGAIQERMANPIQGAFVKLPEPGVYENIAVLDFKGLYPTIIVSYNIDPGTLVTGDANEETHESPGGARFLKKPMGLIPYVLDYLIDFRTKLKNKLKDLDPDSEEYKILLARSTAIKVTSNSFYGYLAYARSRWYSKECGESVTAYGRKHINDAIEKAEKKGFKVLYADTDSTFLLMEKKSKSDVLDFMKEINESLPEKMELELEGFYPRGVFVSKKAQEKGAKKKYALLGEDGRIKIRGFELVRRDWSKIAKETQLAVLEAILKDGSKEKAVRIVRETIQRINSGKMTMADLTIVTTLKKDPEDYEVKSPELGAAKKAMASGLTMKKGSVVQYVITKDGDSISEKAELADSAKNYDPDYYINNQILPAVMKILKELGYDEYSLKIGGKQQSLDNFF